MWSHNMRDHREIQSMAGTKRGFFFTIGTAVDLWILMSRKWGSQEFIHGGKGTTTPAPRSLPQHWRHKGRGPTERGRGEGRKGKGSPWCGKAIWGTLRATQELLMLHNIRAQMGKVNSTVAHLSATEWQNKPHLKLRGCTFCHVKIQVRIWVCANLGESGLKSNLAHCMVTMSFPGFEDVQL